jgi:hypothetical protein
VLAGADARLDIDAAEESTILEVFGAAECKCATGVLEEENADLEAFVRELVMRELKGCGKPR